MNTLIWIIAIIAIYIIFKRIKKRSPRIIFKESTTKEPKYIVLDTETTGLFTNRDLNVDKCRLADKPYPIQFAWITLDKDFCIINESCNILKQETTIPSIAKNIHGISTSRMQKEGVEPTPVYKQFISDLEKATHVIGHNLDFDKKILQVDFRRNKLDHKLIDTKELIDTMKSTTDLVKLPGKYNSYKYPKLSELYGFLFYNNPNKKLNGIHDALVDTKITAKCYQELIKNYSK